ncbi:protein ZBED8-like [Penaeus japonicus]|uniref:protein ZBED8-like n=1 Tax=Penaeus japonicus TaxID=27405 RepID=UPI001C713CA5|nr:protein ZBED8-like [Penaeus japonicus]
MVCFLAEHNLPFTLADHLIELCKVIFPDSKIAQGLHMKKTKCSEVTKALGNCITRELALKLRSNKFSITIDESTDVSSTKCLTLIVKFYDAEAQQIKTGTLDLIDIYGPHNEMVGSTGINLYNLIVATLNANEIPLENLVGFAADGASNIMGEHNSLTSRLRNMAPGITIFRCICHSIQLCASEAVKSLPRHCEDFIRNVYIHFSHSAKRQFNFKQAQIFLEIKPHKILHACQTRWLSLHQAVVLEQWEALKEYFSPFVGTEKLRNI